MTSDLFLKDLWPAESELLRLARRRQEATTGEDRPTDGDEDRAVRGEILSRILWMAASDKDEKGGLRGKGLRLKGAWITGTLSLEGLRLGGPLVFRNCVFEDAPNVRRARVDVLKFQDCTLPGLKAEQIKVNDTVSLKSSDVTDSVQLQRAEILGNLSLRSANVALAQTALAQTALLDCECANIRGSVLLIHTDFQGRCHMPLMTVRGDLKLDHSHFRAASAETLSRTDSTTLADDDEKRTGLRHKALFNFQSCAVQGGFFAQDATFEGDLDLRGAKVEFVVDDRDSWPKPGYSLLLNRFEYRAFGQSAPVSAKDRIDWLERNEPQHWGTDFWPQPYEQLAKVFRQMGHDEDARATLLHKEKAQRAA